jgi:hypothetical protein
MFPVNLEAGLVFLQSLTHHFTSLPLQLFAAFRRRSISWTCHTTI